MSSIFSVVYSQCGSGSSKSAVKKGAAECKRSVTVYVEDFVYQLETKDDGEPLLKKGGQVVPIPSALDGLLTERIANYVILNAQGLGFVLKWDPKVGPLSCLTPLFNWFTIYFQSRTVELSAGESLWNRTSGLCGRINGYWADDFQSRDGRNSANLLAFVNSWQADSGGQECSSGPTESHSCKWDSPEDQAIANAASDMCKRLLDEPRFEKCRKALDPRSYYETCRWDYCQCASSGGGQSQSRKGEECACRALETYFHECLRQGVDLAPQGWRGPSLCRKDQSSFFFFN